MKKNKYLQKIVNQLIKECFNDGKIIESKATKAIKILKSLPTSQSIFALSEFLKGLKRKQREHTLYIETATSISIQQLNKVKNIVEKKVKITNIVTKVNPEILGGFKIKIGDQVWDESISGKITQVKEAING